MSSIRDQDVSLETFKTMADVAGLGMSQTELEELTPLYDLYLRYISQLHSIDYGAEEIALSFEPDWAS